MGDGQTVLDCAINFESKDLVEIIKEAEANFSDRQSPETSKSLEGSDAEEEKVERFSADNQEDQAVPNGSKKKRKSKVVVETEGGEGEDVAVATEESVADAAEEK